MTYWKCKNIEKVNPVHDKLILEELCTGKIPALIIRNFYRKEICEKITKRVSGFSIFYHGDSYLKKIGVFLSAYLNQKEQYFVDAKKSNQQISNIFGVENPINKINNIICDTSRLEKIKSAAEGELDYSCGIIRIWENEDVGPLHRDYASFESPNFKISRHKNQLSCVLYLQSPKKGGELVIHNQEWQKSDEKFRSIGFGYSREVLKGSEYAIVIPKQGDLVIFNPKFFHEIFPTKGESNRLTFGYFIGFSPNSNVGEFWS